MSVYLDYAQFSSPLFFYSFNVHHVSQTIAVTHMMHTKRSPNLIIYETDNPSNFGFLHVKRSCISILIHVSSSQGGSSVLVLW